MAHRRINPKAAKFRKGYRYRYRNPFLLLHIFIPESSIFSDFNFSGDVFQKLRVELYKAMAGFWIIYIRSL
jgi:hypothetical protein